MDSFKKLFGIEKEQIKEDVIITPFLNLEYFKVDKEAIIHKGFLYESLSEKDFTVIKTGVGAPFVGDAVLYLKGSLAKRVYFLGSCGSIGNFAIGSLLLAEEVSACESFSLFLKEKVYARALCVQNKLSQGFKERNKDEVMQARIATLGSLKFQEEVLGDLREHKIDAVDMEASSFFSAAAYLGLEPLTLLYVTDIIGNKPFFRNLEKEEKMLIQDARKKVIFLICEFINQNSSYINQKTR